MREIRGIDDVNLELSDDIPHDVTPPPPITFSENKENTPVFERPIKGYTAHQLLDIIVGRRVCNRNICKQIPRGVRTHAAYVVDTEALGSCDILAFGDDNGSWGGHTKPRRRYSVEVEVSMREALQVQLYTSQRMTANRSLKMFSHCTGITFSIVIPLHSERSSQQSMTGWETSFL